MEDLLAIWSALKEGSPLVLAFFCLTLMFGYLVPKPTYMREVKRNDKLEEQNESLTRLTFDAVATIKETVGEIKEIKEELRSRSRGAR